MRDLLKKDLLAAGATVVGFALVRVALKEEISHLEVAISIGVDRRLNEDTVSLLVALQRRTALRLRKLGYRHLSIPPDSDRVRGTYISRLYPLFTHKIAATSAGLGWIGRNGLLINPEHGPRLSLATVLTDAPFSPDTPVEASLCGSCRLCVDFCPSAALTGRDWTRGEPYVELLRKDSCRSYKKKSKAVSGRPNCGLCINVCPYGRREKTKAAAAVS